jgi:hypothetical protein
MTGRGVGKKKAKASGKTPKNTARGSDLPRGDDKAAKIEERKRLRAEKTAQARKAKEDADLPPKGRLKLIYRGVGQPPINDPNNRSAIEKKIDGYFETCAKNMERPTYSGLTLALGYSDKGEVVVHANAGEQISPALKKATLFIDSIYEDRLFASSPVGAIFALKCRGWREVQADENTAAVIAKLDQVLEGVRSELLP